MGQPVRDVETVPMRCGDDALAGIESLVKAYRPRVVRALRSVMGCSAEEEDLVQEVFVRLVVRLRQPGEIDVGAWLWQVARNLAIDELRRRRPTPVEDDKLERASRVDLDAEVIAGELYVDLVRGLNRLPERQRMALVAQLADRPPAGNELASMLGVSVDAAESVLARARRRLRSAMADVGYGAVAGILGITLVAGSRLRRRVAQVALAGALGAAVVAPMALHAGSSGGNGPVTLHTQEPAHAPVSPLVPLAPVAPAGPGASIASAIAATVSAARHATAHTAAAAPAPTAEMRAGVAVTVAAARPQPSSPLPTGAAVAGTTAACDALLPSGSPCGDVAPVVPPVAPTVVR